MLGRCPRSSLHPTVSKGELLTHSHEIVHLPNSEDEKPAVLQPPHQIVIGFDLGSHNSRNLPTQACESPRSVLEPHHLCFRSHHLPVRSPRSPLSALGSLLSGNPRNDPCTEGAALCLKVGINAEEAAVSAKSHHAFARRGLVASDVHGVDAHPVQSKREHTTDCSKTYKQGDPVTFSRMNYVEVRKNQPCNHGLSCHVSGGSSANCPHSKTILGSDYEDEDKNEAAAADADSDDVDIPVSIFSTASPVASYFRSDSLTVDFLSKCFLCRRHLLLGKDIYMYRGDRAFCSQECRYQQIVVDERKERCPAAVTCVSGASSHHRRLRSANQPTVA